MRAAMARALAMPSVASLLSMGSLRGAADAALPAWATLQPAMGALPGMPSVASLLSGAGLAVGSLWMELPRLEVAPPVPATLFVPEPMGALPGMPSVASLLSAGAAVGSLWMELPGPDAPATLWMDLPKLEIAPRAPETPLWPTTLDGMSSAASLLSAGAAGGSLWMELPRGEAEPPLWMELPRPHNLPTAMPKWELPKWDVPEMSSSLSSLASAAISLPPPDARDARAARPSSYDFDAAMDLELPAILAPVAASSLSSMSSMAYTNSIAEAVDLPALLVPSRRELVTQPAMAMPGLELYTLSLTSLASLSSLPTARADPAWSGADPVWADPALTLTLPAMLRFEAPTSMSSISSLAASLPPLDALGAAALMLRPLAAPLAAPLRHQRGPEAAAERAPTYESLQRSASPVPPSQDAWPDAAGLLPRLGTHGWLESNVVESNGWLDDRGVVSWPAQLVPEGFDANLGEELTKMLMASSRMPALAAAAEPPEYAVGGAEYAVGGADGGAADGEGLGLLDLGLQPGGDLQPGGLQPAALGRQLPPRAVRAAAVVPGSNPLLVMELPQQTGSLAVQQQSSSAMRLQVGGGSAGGVFVPPHCQAPQLTGGLEVVLGSPPGAASGLLAYGAAPVVELGAAGGASYSREFDALYLGAPGSTGAVQASVAGKQYQSAAQVAARPPPVAVHAAVLRTPEAHVDRTRVRVDYQLRDVTGGVRTAAPDVAPRLQLVMGALSAEVACDPAELTSDAFMLRSCALLGLDDAWFVAGGTAAVSLSLMVDGVESVATAGQLTVVARPAWHGSLGGVLVSAGVFARLPASPIYSSDDIDVHIYAHTLPYALDTWTVYLNYDSTLLDYVPGSAEGSPLWTNFAASDQASYLRLAAVGRPDGVTDAATSGAALRLASARFRFKAGTGAITRDAYSSWEAQGNSLLSVQAALFVNPGGNSYLGGWTGAVTGVMLDGRDTSGGSASGQVEVKAVSDVGLFALLESGTLANLTPLTGGTQRYELSAAVVSDRDDTAATAMGVSGVACATGAPTAVLVLDGCTVELGASSDRPSGSGGATVTATYGERQLSAEARFVVWVPSADSVELRVEDALLQRLAFPEGGGTVDCEAAQRYQRTEVSASVGGLDATPLLTFATTDESTAALVGHATLQGLQAGAVDVYILCGRPSTFCVDARVTVTVTDATVRATALRSRVLTSVTWDPRPPSPWAMSSGFGAAVSAAQVMAAED